MNYKHPWVYHGEAPKAGRKLLLLQVDELTFSLPLIYRLIHPAEIAQKSDWFSASIVTADEKQNTQYIMLVELLQRVTQERKKQTNLIEPLTHLNQMLNQYFSDYGWRMVRKELSQIKKRQKKSHIELSKDLIAKLKSYMEQENLDSFDQAIDNLLSEVESFNGSDLQEASN
ncbi:hypothetical protein [Shewanella violacea]|uniref:Uncharacterized protein n=1 Tax=Shewanella violacea (strain JCM 10179 / CIP 106290 / LMG 19151 / DSS12) TaxID=637905 RepID=D4ZKA7_SHEVD|nr:hypothetical protein [Shewanella violacea]BAJ02106.1 conserved hypothetical protein [Shewanella violacea DSS12]